MTQRSAEILAFINPKPSLSKFIELYLLEHYFELCKNQCL